MIANPMISTQILLPVVERLRVEGLRAAPLLEKLNIDRNSLENVNDVVALKQYVAFFEAAAKLTNKPHFGLEAGQAIIAENLGPLGFLFDCAPTLEEALQGLASYLSALQEGTKIILTPDGENVRYEYQILDNQIAPRRQDSEYSIAGTLTMMKRYAGRLFKPLEVCFEHERVGSHSFYEHHFGCYVFFGQASNCIVFEKEALSLGAPNMSNKLYPIIASHLQNIISSKNHSLNFSDHISSLITNEMLEHRVTMGAIAQKLDISESTLSRRLKSEKTSFKDIIANKRMGAAKRLLEHTDIPISQIALRLGYSENASFSRAFKSKMRITPDQYRRSLQNRN